jgi:DNA-binding response OmpR family regulator
VRILLVEDDRKAARILSRGLQEEGFVVDIAVSGEEGEELAGINDYDLIVLDWLLPGTAGIDVCRQLRRRRLGTPILMLTARDAVEDRVAGLDAGADDYLTKPFVFAELLARVRALLRRGEAARLPVLEIADLRLDPVEHRVSRAAGPLELTAKEYAILEYLMRHAGRVVTRAELGDHVWREEHENLTNLIDVHVSHLRRKLDAGDGPALIQTVRGRGFRLSSPGPGPATGGGTGPRPP